MRSLTPARGSHWRLIAALAAGLALVMVWIAPAAPAGAQVKAPARLATADVGFPAIDPDYLYSQLETMVTRYQSREAGYDTSQSTSTSGHDGFATYWQAEMLRNLTGFGAQAVTDSFTIPGWQGRPATSKAFNVEVSVPGVTHPEQVVVIGCHYDGEATSTQSANDDGSGCAIELAVAHALSVYWTAHHLYPARTLRFVIFDAEEQGLWGSFHYVNSTVNGDLSNIVAMINEEQNGIEYPLRYLGKLSNPTLPTTIFVTPLSDNEVYRSTSTFTASEVQAIQRFRSVEQGSAPAVFAAFRALGYSSLIYRDNNNQPVSTPIFTASDLQYVSQHDDNIASSDQYPFSLAGTPTATYIGNYSYYDPSPPPWSYPYDQPDDTLQLMNVYASGSAAPSEALKLALALPGMLTTWTLAQPAILGFASAPAGPVTTISDVGTTTPGSPVALAATGAYDPANPNATFTYSWSFGDGASATGAGAAHTWTSPGDYALRLNVSDTSGSRVVSKTIHVAAYPLAVTNPYTKSQQDGAPPANPAVKLPTAQGAGGTSGTQRAAPSPSSGASQPVWLWLLLLVVVVVAGGAIGAGLLLGRAERRTGGAGAPNEEIEARKRRERALRDLTRPRSGQDG